MTSQRLTTAMRAVPFHPFAIVLVGGREIPVSHPGLIAHAPGGRVAVVVSDDESHEVIDVESIGGLKVSAP